jgi:hypothetical protein
MFRMCSERGCPDDAVEGSSRCAAHQRSQPAQRKEWTAHPLHSTTRYRKFRARIIRERDGLCGREAFADLDGPCRGPIQLHIMDYDDWRNPDKCHLLCRRHHGQRSALDQAAGLVRDRSQDRPARQYGPTGLPLDPDAPPPRRKTRPAWFA